jgi:hypothetical protein
VVTADDDSLFAGTAAAQHKRRVGANAIQIKSDVAGTGKRAVHAIRFFEKQRGCSMGANARADQQQQKDCSKYTPTHINVKLSSQVKVSLSGLRLAGLPLEVPQLLRVCRLPRGWNKMTEGKSIDLP